VRRERERIAICNVCDSLTLLDCIEAERDKWIRFEQGCKALKIN